MISIIRKYQQPLMIIVTVLVIIAFAWLYNDTNLSKVGSDHVATVYGKTVTRPEMDRSQRMMRLGSALQQFEYLQEIIGNVMTESQAMEAFSINQIVLNKEAGDLGIMPTDEAIAQTIRALPVFQKDGRFDVTLYSKFLERVLAPNGFTQAQLEEVVRNQLRFQKIYSLVGSAAGVSETETRNIFEQNHRVMAISVIRLKQTDVQGQVSVTDEQIKALYDQTPDAYKSEETRKVRFIRLALSEEEQKLEGRDRVQAMQQLSQRAGEFTQAMLEPGMDFDAVAKRFGIEVETSGEFGRFGGDPAMAAVPALIPAAFSLTETDPDSDAVTFKDGFYVLHLDTISPSQSQTLEQAKERISAELTETKSRELLEVRAAEIRKSVQDALAAGGNFQDAAKAAGAEAEIITPYSLSNQNFELQDLREITVGALQLKPGEVGEFSQTQSGGVLVFLEKIEPIKEEEFTKEKALVGGSILKQRKNVLFQEWLRDRRAAANIRMSVES